VSESGRHVLGVNFTRRISILKMGAHFGAHSLLPKTNEAPRAANMADNGVL
jgi:hypothetical protein